jgi:GNAT superfamily N-acetyltransferase
MDYHAGNTSEQADARPAHLGACEVNEDAKILSETTPADVSLDIIPQNRVRLGYREPHDVIRTYDANILVDAPGHSKAADYEDLKVGTLRFHIINMEFPRERGSFTDHPRSICDSHSGEMYGLYAALYQDNGELKRSVANRIDPDAGGWCSVFAILFVELLSIDKEFRGHKFGPGALEIAVRHYGLGCQVAALAARAFETDRDTPEGIAFDKRLRRMYKKHGFVPLPKSDFMVRNLENWAPQLDWLKT